MPYCSTWKGKSSLGKVVWLSVLNSRNTQPTPHILLYRSLTFKYTGLTTQSYICFGNNTLDKIIDLSNHSSHPVIHSSSLSLCLHSSTHSCCSSRDRLESLRSWRLPKSCVWSLSHSTLLQCSCWCQIFRYRGRGWSVSVVGSHQHLDPKRACVRCVVHWWFALSVHNISSHTRHIHTHKRNLLYIIYPYIIK